MSISRIVLTVCVCMSFMTMSCSAIKSYKFYLDKDETHRDVYEVTAKISSDGSCSFSIGDDERYAGLLWKEPDELKNIVDIVQIYGFCEQHPIESYTEGDQIIRVPTMTVIVVTPKNIDREMLKSGILLDVIPINSYAPYNNPVGVYFNIREPQTVKTPKGVYLSLEVASLKGEATVKSLSDGSVTLSISALGHATGIGAW